MNNSRAPDGLKGVSCVGEERWSYDYDYVYNYSDYSDYDYR